MFAIGSSEMTESEQDFPKHFTLVSYALNQMSGKIKSTMKKISIFGYGYIFTSNILMQS
jgi:hypothetical protein